MPSVSPIQIIPYSPSQHAHLLQSIADLHMTTILHDNAVMRFHPPFTPSKKQQVLEFWRARLSPEQIEGGERTMLIALAEGVVVGDEGKDTSTTINGATKSNTTLIATAELLHPLSAPDTGPFRAEVEMLMVLPRFRRHGLAKRLMTEIEHVARQHGRTMLTLSTTAGSVAAEKFYPGIGWVRYGELTGYGWGWEWEDREGEGEGRRGDGDGNGEGRKVKRTMVDGVYFYKDLSMDGTAGDS